MHPVYIIALAFYKHWLHSQYDVMNRISDRANLRHRRKTLVLVFLLTGFAFIILLVCMGVHLFQKGQVRAGKPCRLDLEHRADRHLVTVFWDPIFTTFVVLAFVAGTSAAAMS